MLEKVSWQFGHYSVVQGHVHHAYFSLMRFVFALLDKCLLLQLCCSVYFEFYTIVTKFGNVGTFTLFQ